jgi:Phage tail assembly chaperone proteins, E, or 41 or 14
MATNKTPAWLIIGNDGITIKLHTPTELNGVKVDKVTMRTPTVGDMRSANKLHKDDKEDRELFMFATLIQCGTEDMERLTLRDYGRIQEGYFRISSPDEVTA